MTASPDGRCSLIVSSTTNTDSGQYACEVANDAGTTKSEAIGTVMGIVIYKYTY